MSFANSSLDSTTTRKTLTDLAERLRTAQSDDDYVETDLQRWTTILEKLKNDLYTPSSRVMICQDPTKILLVGISASILSDEKHSKEIFGEVHGQVRIENNGSAAKYCGDQRGDAFVRGISEYRSGKHKIRLMIRRHTTSWDMLFGIVSKRMSTPELADKCEYSIFGWWSNDEIYPRTDVLKKNKPSRDLKGEIRLEIELTLDCDHHTISYFNERTRAIRQLNIDMMKCPFPWQLLINLYGMGDQVRLFD